MHWRARDNVHSVCFFTPEELESSRSIPIEITVCTSKSEGTYIHTDVCSTTQCGLLGGSAGNDSEYEAAMPSAR